jgi:3-deoxy-D-manno-octulosonate 8-phosphate phosphatase (KDO 8-P phosphatase)
MSGARLDPAVAARVRYVAFDVDGVLTDGGIYLGAADGAPVELKRYDIQDGLGMRFLRDAGLGIGILTGRVSESVRMRGLELAVDDVVQDPEARKLDALLAILRRRGLSPMEVAFVGDDFPDLAVLRVVGLPVAVGNAVPEVTAACALRLERRGGHGAVREFAERLLRARGQWDGIVDAYVAERSRPAAEAVA